MTEAAGPHCPGENRDSVAHQRQMARLLGRLPKPIGRAAAWLLRPDSRWLRIPLGGALIVGSLLSFLPVFGVWMLPLGALLLAEDFPFIRRPTTRAIEAVERWWARRRSRRFPAGDSGKDGPCGPRQGP